MSESSEEAAAQTRLGGGVGRANPRRTSRTSSSSSSSSSTTSNSPEKANENDDGLLGVIGARCSYDLDYVDYEDELGESQGPSPTDQKSHPDTTTQSIIKQEEKKPAAVKKRLSKCPSENNLRRALENDEEERSTESSRRKNLSDRFQQHNRDRNVYNFHNTQLVIQDNNQALTKDEQQVRNDRVNVKDDEKKADNEQQNNSDESLVIINVNETQIIDEATGNSNPNPVNPSTHLTYSKNQSTTSSKTSHKAMKRFQSENNLYIKNMSVVYNNQTKDEKGGSPENNVNDNDKTKSCGLEIAKYNFSTDEDPNKV